MIVIAIIGILAALAVGAYQTYTIRAQVTEGLSFTAHAKTLVAEAFVNAGDAPATLADAGMPPNPADIQGKYVAAVDVVNGRVDVTFGNEVNQEILGLSLSLTPYQSPSQGVIWRCGNAPQPAGVPMGTGSGGDVAVHLPPTVPPKYLPSSCR